MLSVNDELRLCFLSVVIKHYASWLLGVDCQLLYAFSFYLQDPSRTLSVHIIKEINTDNLSAVIDNVLNMHNWAIANRIQQY